MISARKPTTKLINFTIIKIVIFVALLMISKNAIAQIQIPESADPARFDNNYKDYQTIKPLEQYPQAKPLSKAKSEIPEETKNIKFVLNGIIIEGSTVFEKEELKKLYEKKLAKKISLYEVWQIAQDISNYYAQEGYFLSIAIIPPQEISSRGIVKIKIIEGYIGEVELDEETKKNAIARNTVKKLLQQKPSNIKTVENVMLTLNDIPSRSFEAVIEGLPNKQGVVKLSILSKRKEDVGQVTFDNYNSKFTGSNEAIIQYKKSLTQNSATSISYITSLPFSHLEYFNLFNEINLSSSVFLEFYGSKTRTDLGASLKQFDVTSDSNTAGIAIKKQIIRQRDKNFAIKFELEGRNIASDILGSPLTRDQTREAKISLIYDGRDFLGGYNYTNITLANGLSILGASKTTDQNLSRQKVDPHYTRLEITKNRFQNLGDSFLMINSVAAQLSSGRLYSSSKFTYGGQLFGRAYDQSEVAGDRGVNAGIEMRYISLPKILGFNVSPFIYYDIGRVWDAGFGEEATILTSIGEGLRFELSNSLFLNFTVANPIGEKSDIRSYIRHNDARYLVQASYRF